MKHRVAGRKLGRTSAHRTSMLANMASSLVLHGRIETTLPKAKELRHIADRIVTLGKRGTLAARRHAIALIRNKHAVHKAFAELAARFQTRAGGYTRVLKLGFRHGDSAPMAMIEYLPAARAAGESEASEKVKKPAAKKQAKKAAPRSEGEAPSKSAMRAEKSISKRAPAAKKAPTRQKKPTGGA